MGCDFSCGTIGPIVEKDGKVFVTTCEHVIQEAVSELQGDKSKAMFFSPGKCRRMFDIIQETRLNSIYAGKLGSTSFTENGVIGLGQLAVVCQHTSGTQDSDGSLQGHRKFFI